MRKWCCLAMVVVMLCLIMAGCGEPGKTTPTTTQSQNLESTATGSQPMQTTEVTQPATQPTQPTTQPVATTQPTEPAPPPTTHPLECEYVEVEIVSEGSCVTRKEVLYECVYCGEQYVDKVSSGIPHDFAQILTTKIPGCGVDGEVSQVCTMCGREAFFKEIPRTSEHNLTLLEDKEYTKYFAGKRRYKCENCGAIVYEYYGEYGVYDLDAIKEAMTQYVRQYGFNIEIAESGDEITDGKFYYHDFYLCEIMGAHDYLYDKVFASVERWCQKHLENCQEYGTDPRLYTCTVYLGFYESGSMGGSSFVVYVTAS